MQSKFKVVHPGVHSLIQDNGRVGFAHLGVTTGGVADKQAYYWLNRMLQNEQNAACIEITFGGLKLHSLCEQVICLTGADMPLTINGQLQRNWCSHQVKSGDVIAVGYAKSGLRSYFGVHRGFKFEPQFGSCSTVVREQLGGLNGQALKVGDELGCDLLSTITNGEKKTTHVKCFALGVMDIPRYHQTVTIRVVLGYQYQAFEKNERDVFFNNEYLVSKQFDRMGYRLHGVQIHSNVQALKSEGICYGAIQIPPDGQPIILLNDRQTLGGYPKLGSIFSLDGDKLAQCGQGAKINFVEITAEHAKQLLIEAQSQRQSIQLKRFQPSSG
ncbi:biotin-dependent carboxyltransferase family protein [Thalassotalea atypica]|uniref:5-oxoprolinase subunit C family protein n=1 Tax=Thalassotalea atypica TaxID=2054316 RepID=UPI0025729B03|nr:biotin-dependent carboxyltransferase family protein [Thalassotalea atypica]